MVVNCFGMCMLESTGGEADMGGAMELENLALGDLTLEEGTRTVLSLLTKLTEESMHRLYEALRSWTWKALESRRRDEELTGWMELFSLAAGKIEERSSVLAIKLEAHMELIHASIMVAGESAGRDPFDRKHVRQAMQLIYTHGGRMRRQGLMSHLHLKAPNLSRVMNPLENDGLIMREIEGREVFYRLTMKGNEAVLPYVSQLGEMTGAHLAAAMGAVKLGNFKWHVVDDLKSQPYVLTLAGNAFDAAAAPRSAETTRAVNALVEHHRHRRSCDYPDYEFFGMTTEDTPAWLAGSLIGGAVR